MTKSELTILSALHKALSGVLGGGEPEKPAKVEKAKPAKPKTAGRPPKAKTGKAPKKKELKALYDRNSIAACAEEVGCTPAEMKEMLINANIEIRGRGQKPPKA